MSRYTTKGSAQLDEKIEADLKRITDLTAPHTSAGILMGGYGRGEGTPFIQPDGSQAPFNDYDLIVIVEDSSTSVRQKLRPLEKELSDQLHLTVDLYPYPLNKLPHCEFSLLNYEMKYGHQVIWGDPHILDALPDFPHTGIPPFEGSRLLLNRGKLLLDIKQRLLQAEPLSPDERICFIKFIHKVLLAFGDCALLAENQYDISYAVKKKRINTIDDCPHREEVVNGYLKAVELKEWGDYNGLDSYDIEIELSRVIKTYLDFMPWYRAQYKMNECALLKAAALNLKWNGRPLFRHPRLYLYDAITELLKDEPEIFLIQQALFSNDNLVERFYLLQQRFS
jgi:predicted nucleotidyltransferase